MNIFYRGYLIQREIQASYYTIFDRRPQRMELTACDTSVEAMQWVDGQATSRASMPSAWAQLTLL